MHHRRLLNALVGAVVLSLLAVAHAHAGTTKPAWTKTSDCAVSTSLPKYFRKTPKCNVFSTSGTINSHQEHQYFKAEGQFMVVLVYIAGHKAVWRSDNLKSIMTNMKDWLDKQEARFTKAEQRTLPVNLWVKRAKHYDLSMKDYGDGCFAFTSVGGGAGSSGSAYQLGVVVCNRDGSPIGIAERMAISESISITHKLYREPRSTF